MLIPYPSEEMEVYEISTYVNSPMNNAPECIELYSFSTLVTPILPLLIALECH